MDVGQQMDVILLTAKLHQLAAPSGEAISERFLEVIKQFRRQRFTPIFRHKK